MVKTVEWSRVVKNSVPRRELLDYCPDERVAGRPAADITMVDTVSSLSTTTWAINGIATAAHNDTLTTVCAAKVPDAQTMFASKQTTC